MPSFDYEGFRISYEVHGSGDRPLVMTHGLLMNRTMFANLAPEMASRGNKVIMVDLLGHGESDQPHEHWHYSMTQFGLQVIALLDHLEIDKAVIGGTSLGANITLEVADLAPERVRGMLVEMPVLDNALLAAGAVFTPLAIAIHYGKPGMRLLAQLTRRIPRSVFMADIALDWLRRDPEPSEAVLLGLLNGRTAPHRSRRQLIDRPALVIGHPADPLHPFSDADMLVDELRNARLLDANSALEWRINPRRLNDEFGRFLDDVWSGELDGDETADTDTQRRHTARSA
ncbi:MAG: alpha/beta fold hydrolase [Solirubrobacterales bacterium]